MEIGNTTKRTKGCVIKRAADGPIDRFKSRLVIKGFLQRCGIDYNEIFSPVVCMEVLRLLLAIGAALDWEIEQMDVNTAFLNGSCRKKQFFTNSEKNDMGKITKGELNLIFAQTVTQIQ